MTFFLKKIEREEIFKNIQKVIKICEGKFFFFFIWGANIEYIVQQPSDTAYPESDSSVNNLSNMLDLELYL